MKFSDKTMKLLKNFSTINQNILFRKGNVITTISNAKNLIAKTVIDEDIPKEFSIYDLNSLLAMISYDKDNGSEIEFASKSLKIKNSFGVFEHFYTQPEFIVIAPKNIVEYDTVHSFELTEKQLKVIEKSSAITNAEFFTLMSIDGRFDGLINNRIDETSNKFTIDLGNADIDFNVYVDITDIKIIPGDYTVEVALTPSGKTCVLVFNNNDIDLQYMLACKIGSKIGEK